MKAITLWQPWATLVAEGQKPFEFRSWKPSSRLIGERLAIHAAARPANRLHLAGLERLLTTRDPAVCLRPEALAVLRGRSEWPRGVIVCTAVYGGVAPPEEVAAEFGLDRDAWLGDKDGLDLNHAWRLTDVEPTPPIPARGRLGLWDAGEVP